MQTKFLLIASFPDSILTFRGDLIKALQYQQLEIHVVAPDITRSLKNKLTEMGVVVHDIYLERTGTNPASDFKYLLSLYKLIKEIKPKYTLGYTIKPVIYGSLAAKLANVNNRFSLITGLGYAFTGEVSGKRQWLQKVLQTLYKVALTANKTVFFQNNDDKTLFEQLGLVNKQQNIIVVNGSGIDIDKFKAVDLPEVPSFLLIARLLGDKGVREYAQAAGMLHKQCPDIKCSLVGWIDNNPDAISQMELDEWVKSGAIEYLGRLSDVQSVIQDSSIYVLPSYREGTPRTVLEAMAMQRAIITTDAPGCRETVIDKENGLLVPVKDSHALYESMLYLVEHPEEVKRMAKASRLMAEDKFDVHKVNKVMLTGMGIIE
ncbi:N, N'-diacetylbacillosaminyl-diphospho-undecaprenol alpha-1,3-N-acetylgalactosaminyltransferase [Photobacterium piscicola]|uniref:N, N'-diacetylbacillosaminyl-diphospho-undecaprenol alpha-1,3-N-acetylgalactosaminyltransferase n=1 Tax=Photobacterium piscicola TaxID=1378299 RepID=A0A1T5HVY0_9GAMM|nr:glycosyltransferase family 4 protein [Photobacterium piscicola]SKC30955.1 N, N'-diacetylbacillosaminyl-diphospho-undecaprenol alpha-1,3-N-acetylgalactosaminyltransferase [Photobacterium piscicola]